MFGISPTLIILQSSIDVAGDNEVGRDKGGGNKTNLSNLYSSKKSTRVGDLTSKGTKKGGSNLNSDGNNTKKGVKAARGFDYLT